jgi:hypothetical protein
MVCLTFANDLHSARVQRIGLQDSLPLQIKVGYYWSFAHPALEFDKGFLLRLLPLEGNILLSQGGDWPRNLWEAGYRPLIVTCKANEGLEFP